MKTAPFILLIILSSSLAYAAPPRYRVIKVHTPLSMGTLSPDSTASNDYYVTIGREHGLKTGTLLNVYRDKQIEDETSGVSITTRVFVGQLRVIQVHDKYCVSRVVELAGSADPLRERDAVLVVDYVLPFYDIQGEQLFAKGSSKFLPEAIKHLEEAALFIQSNNPSLATIEGHTDNDGSPAYNLKLSELRAAAVRDYLINESKIDLKILFPVGCGESRPIAPNDTPEGQAMNRRFEIIIEK
jgi:outer membrane protein OmpA-like peptidoglycan-associated protein